MKSYQYILLDWDGNLAMTLDLWLKALKAPLEARGHFLSDAEIGADFGAFKERMQVRGIEDIDAIVAEADEMSAKELPSVELYSDALKVLESLRKSGKRTALVTTSEHRYIDPLLKKYQMEQLFHTVICGDDVVHHKPHAEPLLKAIAILNADPSHTIMIGDSDKDIGAAHNAGIDSILFYPPGHDRFFDVEYLKSLHPTFVVSDFTEVLTITA